jgi:hypothetical protein
MEQDSLSVELPLEDKFFLRKTEVAIKNLTKDELEQVHLRLVWQQMMERKALKMLLKQSNIDIAFDAPSTECFDEMEELCNEDNNDDPFQFLYN